MPFDWHAMAAVCDNLVDDNLGEPIQFVPWVESDGYLNEGAIDEDRVLPDARCCFVNPKTMIEQGGGTHGAGFITRIANADLIVSVRDAYIGGLREGDRIILPERKPTGEYLIGADPAFMGKIAYIDGADSDRTLLYLLLVKNAT